MTDRYFVMLANSDGSPAGVLVDGDADVSLFASEVEARLAMERSEYAQAFGFEVYPWSGE